MYYISTFYIHIFKTIYHLQFKIRFQGIYRYIKLLKNADISAIKFEQISVW